MHARGRLGLAVLILSLTAASGGAGYSAEPAKFESVEPSPDAARVIAVIHDFRRWPTFAENSKPARSKAHGGVYVVAHHNAVVQKAIRERTLPLPDGSVIVKENRATTDGPAIALSTMSKQGGAWYYLQSTPEGRVVLEKGKPLAGTPAACAGCHSQQASNDFLYTHDFSR
jgi:hypothetical protein